MPRPRRFPLPELKLDLRSMREALARMKRGELFKKQ
jgi:hypothetical protein